ncbi:MAG: arylesterase [Desulfobacterales bacterium]|nr:MAG: arylesterase [Desulfobacterales bacterium]
MHKSKCNFFFILILIISSYGCGEESTPVLEKNQADYEGIILAIGDSLTEGLGVEEKFAYPAVLQRKLFENGYMYKVVNAGVSGETSSGALSRLKWALTLQPAIAILVTGANDGLRGIDPELIKTNISSIVQVLKEKDIVVVLGGMQMVQNLGQDYTTAFSKIYPQIAQDQDVILIPFFLAAVGGKADLNQSDGIHPTAEGYRIIVENIYPYIMEAIRMHRSNSK